MNTEDLQQHIDKIKASAIGNVKALNIDVPVLRALIARIESLAADAERTNAALSALLPGPYYMDPPDGGSVTVLEQVGRMAKDAERYRWLRECDWFSSPLCVLRDPKKVLTSGIGLGADCPSQDRLDQAIDAAIAAGDAK